VTISAITKTLVIGSRGSQLALWQARYIAAELQRAGVESRIEIIKTTGDHLQTASLMQAGGKGLFTKEIEEALLAGTIDLAVHSLKDLPTDLPQGLTIAALPKREDPRDAIAGCTLSDLPNGARVGTSSGRRAAQLRILSPGVDIQPIRGNVDTRLRKLRDGEYDAIVLAAAGLRRLGLEQEIAEILSPDQICPAAGQGALAIETREGGDVMAICQQAGLDDVATRAAVRCERAALAALGGGCQLPVGVHAESSGETLRVTAIVASLDGRQHVRGRAEGSAAEADRLGEGIAADLLARGAADILNATK
jgi:hydroxymethylbilane synthase